MSNRQISTTGQSVVARSPSFAERLVSAGFKVPDQKKMKRMMRAAAIGLPWGAINALIVAAENLKVKQQFMVLPQEEYWQVTANTMGAPTPGAVSQYIHAMKQRFPDVKVYIHALPNDDPFVELVLDGESVFVAAWLRSPGGYLKVYLEK
jgi:hypothetical protein